MKKCTLLIYSTLLFWACTKTNEPITNNSNTLEISNELSLNPYLPQAISVHKTQPNYIYVAAKNGGLIVLKETSSTLTQQAQLPINLFNNKEVMHLFQEGNYLYLALGNFFESGHKAGLAIVDISTPDNPTITDIIEADNTANGSAYIHVKDNYAYLCAMNNGLLIFDIQNKQQIQLLSQFVPDKNFPTPNPNSIQEPNARGFDIKDNYAYLCYDAGGIRVIDVSDKKNPQEISQYINGTFNKQKAYNNILINGNYAYVASDYCGLETLDISNPYK